MAKIQQILESETEIHPALKVLLEQRKNLVCQEDSKLITSSVAVIVTSRSDYSSGGGIARHSILHVLYKDEVQIKEWQYCDKYDHHRDRRELMILEIGEVKITTEGEEIKVVVECIPPAQHAHRRVTYTFRKKEDVAIIQPLQLLEETQREFEKWVEETRAGFYDRIMEIWKNNTHTMPTPHGRMSYIQPRIKDVRLNKALGIGVIIVEEQIDFSTTGDPQMQQKAYILLWQGKKIHLGCEKHAYTKEGSATIEVIDISPKSLTLGTLGFNKTIFFEALSKNSED